jgi:hypothetical protein
MPLPPPPPPPISVEQQADLDCLSVAKAMGLAPPHGRKAFPDRMAKFYLLRLRYSDPARDWLSLATADPDMPYGEFMGRWLGCDARMKPIQHHSAGSKTSSAK